MEDSVSLIAAVFLPLSQSELTEEDRNHPNLLLSSIENLLLTSAITDEHSVSLKLEAHFAPRYGERALSRASLVDFPIREKLSLPQPLTIMFETRHLPTHKRSMPRQYRRRL